MVSSDNPIKRPVGRPKKNAFDLVKRPVGRPPKNAPANKYTGIRAQNIDYVRQYLRSFLEEEKSKKQDLDDRNSKSVRGIRSEVTRKRLIVLVCRLLLACEGVNVISNTHRLDKVGDKINNAGAEIKQGKLKLPDLLLEFGDGIDDDAV